MHPQVEALLQATETRYGFRRVAVTSWVGASVTAYLTPNQIELLADDKSVRLLTEDHDVTFSSSLPPWYPAWNGSAWTELNDWGRVAVNGKQLLPGSQRKVYVIDSGVAFHGDLGNVVQRVNLACETGYDCSSSYGYPAVSCYAHGTHVAGIVGATADNGQNRMGVYAGVPIVSINGATAFATPCSYFVNLTVSTVGVALDYIRYQNTAWMGFNTPVQIVNLSANNAELGFSAAGVAQSNWSKVQSLVTPAWASWYVYNGAVFVNSAGNEYRDACTLSAYTDSSGIPRSGSPAFKTSAYASSTLTDGVMVVGAIDSAALPAVGFLASQPVGLTGSEPGSNFGPCVDLWAPGNFIYSTWGYGPFETSASVTYFGGQPSSFVLGSSWTGYSGWAWLSGTSMAAPHVVAAAAYIADKYQLTTPADIEAATRQWSRWFGGYDAAGSQVKVVYLPD